MGRCHCECSHDQAGVDGGAHRPTDDSAAVEIQDTREIEPAILGVNVGAVGDPDLVGGRACGASAR